MTQDGKLLLAQLFPMAPFGRKDGLVYLLPSAVLPESSLDVSASIKSGPGPTQIQNRISQLKAVHTNSAKKSLCILPSHSLEVLNTEDWESLKSESESIILQVTAGPELIHLKLNLLRVLDRGFSVQIWFDNPKQYRELCECWQSLYPEQIYLCFLPNKNFAYELILQFQIRENFLVFFLPKQSALDANLNFEEVLWLEQALSEKQVETRVLVLPELLNQLKPEEKEFYCDISYARLENILARKNKVLFAFLFLFRTLQKLNFHFLLDFLKQCLLFFAKPTLQSMKALLDISSAKVINFLGNVKLVVIDGYWLLNRFIAAIKKNLWDFHRGPYQYIWRGRLSVFLFLNASFWFFYKVLLILIIKSIHFVKNIPVFFVRLFWAVHRGPVQILVRTRIALQLRFILTFWAIYNFVFRSGVWLFFFFKSIPAEIAHFFWMVHRGPYQVFWKTRVGFLDLLNLIFWRFYNLGMRTVVALFYGVLQFFSWLQQLAWAFHRGPFQLLWRMRVQVLRGMLFIFWSLFSLIYFAGAKIIYSIKSVPGRMVQLFWAFHRSPYQLLVHMRAWIEKCLILSYWKCYWVLTQSKAFVRSASGFLAVLVEKICIRFYWWLVKGVRRIFLMLTLLYWASYWLVTQAAARTRAGFGFLAVLFERLCISAYWRTVELSCRILLRGKLLYWFLYWATTQSLAILRRASGKFAMVLESLFIKIFWKAYFLFSKIAGAGLWTKGYLKYVAILLYWRVGLRLWYVFRFPVFKIYWFISFQIRKRLLKRVVTS